MRAPSFPPRGAPVDQAIAATRDLGARLGRSAEAEALVDAAGVRFAVARTRLAGVPRRPVVPLGFIDARHARVYGPGSLFAGVMDRIGLSVGWSKPTNAWGFSIIGIEALADYRDADLLIVQPVPSDARRSMEMPGLWSSLVAANRSRVMTIPPVWAFGDITAAMRCADVLADALTIPSGAIPGEAAVHG